jgi:pilus assembly protein CpaF
VVNALRMRPDRIVVGEVRGEEALDMLQAMNTGHDGSLTTVHANTPRDALTRVETMIAMGATNLPEKAMRHQISSAIQIVVPADSSVRWVAQGDKHLGDHRHGRRHHHHAGHLRLRETGSDSRKVGSPDGSAPLACGRKCAERLKAAGIVLPPNMFDGVTEVR